MFMTVLLNNPDSKLILNLTSLFYISIKVEAHRTFSSVSHAKVSAIRHFTADTYTDELNVLNMA